MKAKEIRELSPDELLHKEKELKGKHFNLKIQHATKQLTNTAQMQHVKRDIARVKTLARQFGNNAASKKREHEVFFETPMHNGAIAYCSDNACDCGDPGASIHRGRGYLYVSSEVVESRRDCLTYVAFQAKLERLRTGFGLNTTLSYEVVPELCCERSARRRRLNMDVAAEDARRWWSTGRVPLRATPTK